MTVPPPPTSGPDGGPDTPESFADCGLGADDQLDAAHELLQSLEDGTIPATALERRASVIAAAAVRANMALAERLGQLAHAVMAAAPGLRGVVGPSADLSSLLERLAEGYDDSDDRDGRDALAEPSMITDPELLAELPFMSVVTSTGPAPWLYWRLEGEDESSKAWVPVAAARAVSEHSGLTFGRITDDPTRPMFDGAALLARERAVRLVRVGTRIVPDAPERPASVAQVDQWVDDSVVLRMLPEGSVVCGSIPARHYRRRAQAGWVEVRPTHDSTQYAPTDESDRALAGAEVLAESGGRVRVLRHGWGSEAADAARS
jgi:hypothetical protein